MVTKDVESKSIFGREINTLFSKSHLWFCYLLILSLKENVSQKFPILLSFKNNLHQQRVFAICHFRSHIFFFSLLQGCKLFHTTLNLICFGPS